MTPRLIFALSAAVVLAGCASHPLPAGVGHLVCSAGSRALHGVRVTTRGTRLSVTEGQPPILERASRLDQAGMATLSCRPRAGRLTDCRILVEGPDGFMFGRSAITYAERVVYPSAETPERVEVTVHFDVVRPRVDEDCS